MKTWLIVGGLVLLGAAAAIFLIDRQRQSDLLTSGFVECERVRVGSRVGGRVAEVAVQEGQSVAAGQVLFRLEPFDLHEQLAQAQQERAAWQAEAKRLSAGYRPQEVASARAARDRAAAVVARLRAGAREQELAIARARADAARGLHQLARIERDRLQPLVEQSTVSRTELDKAEQRVLTAAADLAVAEQQLSLLVAGTRKEDIAEADAALADADARLQLHEAGYRPEDVASSQARLAGAEARVEALNRYLQELVVRSPEAAVVETIDLHPGDLVGPNAPAVNLLRLDETYVRTFVPQSRLPEVKLGMKVPVRAAPDHEPVQGVIRFIAASAEFTPRNVQTPEERSRQVFRVKVALPPGTALRPGMIVDVLLQEAAP